MRRQLERAVLAALRRIDPETAHAAALLALRLGLGPRPGPITSPRLATRIAGLTLPNPVGLAAGFDKNAVALPALTRMGFGLVEVGAVTPRPQPGNPRPRLFRLPEDRAVINRFGFNSEGMEAVARRLARWRAATEARPGGRSGDIPGEGAVPVGLNLGANKDSSDRSADYASLIARCGPLVDFVTVNVSSPNTEALRALQGRAALRALLGRVARARAVLERPLPVFLKIAPDLDHAALDDIAEVALDSGIDAIVATNTTVARGRLVPGGLRSARQTEAGGLSGRPLFELSTRILAGLSRRLGHRLPLIGVGGIGSAEDAYAKIRAGASAVQLYTALVFEGPGLVAEIVEGLDRLLARDGFASVADAVGTGRDLWT